MKTRKSASPSAAAKAARFIKFVEWSEADQVYIGRCPGLFAGGVRGDNEAKFYKELCDVVAEWIINIEKGRRSLCQATTRETTLMKYAGMSRPHKALYGVGLAIAVAFGTSWLQGNEDPEVKNLPSNTAGSGEGAALNGKIVGNVNKPKFQTERSLLAVDGTRKRVLQEALATGDKSKWAPVMGDLMNPIFQPEQVISTLESLLDYPNPSARTMAASLLLELGSWNGVEVLQNTIRDAAKGRDVPLDAVQLAASTLQRFQQAIDQKALFDAYLRFNNNDLLVVATMQNVPQVKDVILKMRAEKESQFRTDWLAAFLGMSDSDSLKRYSNLLHGNSDAQLLGHWALYRATGELSHLKYVIAKAREEVGLDQASGRSTWMTKANAFDFLEITVVPESTKALEDIANFSASKDDQNVSDFSRVFGALFYLHKDYKFIDQTLIDFFSGRFTGKGVARGLLYKIAVARGAPEIQTAARAANPTAYEQAFVAVHGRPIESWWNNQNYVPLQRERQSHLP